MSCLFTFTDFLPHSLAGATKDFRDRRKNETHCLSEFNVAYYAFNFRLLLDIYLFIHVMHLSCMHILIQKGRPQL